MQSKHNLFKYSLKEAIINLIVFRIYTTSWSVLRKFWVKAQKHYKMDGAEKLLSISQCQTTVVYIRIQCNSIVRMIRIFSGTDMIKIWNWFKAIGSFVRKIKEKNTSADLSFWGAICHGTEMSRIGVEVSWCRFVPVPKRLEFVRTHCYFQHYTLL